VIKMVSLYDHKANAKRAWALDEDRALIKMVRLNGPHGWVKLANGLQDRSGKQCRERWYHHLAPDVKKGDWTEEEDAAIMKAVSELGPCWSFIVKRVPGRTDHAIKVGACASPLNPA
jgi:myb proto-oncogene protein